MVQLLQDEEKEAAELEAEWEPATDRLILGVFPQQFDDQPEFINFGDAGGADDASVEEPASSSPPSVALCQALFPGPDDDAEEEEDPALSPCETELAASLHTAVDTVVCNVLSSLSFLGYCIGISDACLLCWALTATATNMRVLLFQ